MNIEGQKQIDLSVERTWVLLNDPQVLKQCIAGCEELSLVEPDRYRAVLQASVGPVKARFTGTLVLSDVQAPHAYKLSFEGNGGVVGLGRGEAKVTLEAAEGGTCLRYDVQARVAGKLAQVGSRLIESVARKMADDFFARFNALAAERAAQQARPA